MVRRVVTPARRLSHDELCTVEAAATHLQVHPKTVLRYIRDGRLPAAKIGKAYRIRRGDLDTFAGVPPTTVDAADAARVTSVIDVRGVGPTLASKIAAAVTNSLQGSRDRRGDVHAEVVYDVTLAQLKVIVVGSVADTRSLLGLVEIWLEQLTP
jgi:excisionase family DNA binding protein